MDKLNQSSSQTFHFMLTIYDKNKQVTFQNKFYIAKNDNYTEIFKKIADILYEYNIDFDPIDLLIMIFGGRMPSESSIKIEHIDE